MTIEQYEMREYLNTLCEVWLTENMKKYLREKYVYGYTMKEMASKRNMTVGMIEWRIQKIKRKVRRSYATYRGKLDE